MPDRTSYYLELGQLDAMSGIVFWSHVWLQKVCKICTGNQLPNFGISTFNCGKIQSRLLGPTRFNRDKSWYFLHRSDLFPRVKTMILNSLESSAIWIAFVEADAMSSSSHKKKLSLILPRVEQKGLHTQKILLYRRSMNLLGSNKKIQLPKPTMTISTVSGCGEIPTHDTMVWGGHTSFMTPGMASKDNASCCINQSELRQPGAMFGIVFWRHVWRPKARVAHLDNCIMERKFSPLSIPRINSRRLLIGSSRLQLSSTLAEANPDPIFPWQWHQIMTSSPSLMNF